MIFARITTYFAERAKFAAGCELDRYWTSFRLHNFE